MMKDIYILSNLINNTTDINSPLKNTQRVKYTCFDVSKSYIVFGASSGSLYIFQRKPCKFLQLIPNKYRTIKNLSISPNERFIAFTTQKGIISVLVINISAAASSSSSSSLSSSTSAPAGTVTTNSLPQLITANINVNNSADDDHNNGDDTINRTISISKQSTVASSSSSSATVTATTSTASNQLIGSSINNLSNNGCLYWSSDEKQFYYGNHKGEVYLITLTLFVGKTLIDISVHPILYLDTPIVQISEYESLLLVSNYTKCILCNMDYEEYKQIGNQPRDGLYGGCFSILDKNNYQTARIYCTRPGYRIWEINLEGNVLKTHEYKLAIGCQPTKIFNNDNDKDDEQNHQMMMNERNDLYKKNNENIIHNKNDSDDNDDNNDEKCEKYENLENDPNDDNDDDTNNDESNKQLQNNLQFTKLYTINNDKFIITYNNNGLYIIDPRDQSLILWTNKFKNIQYCNIINNNEIYIFTANGNLYSIQLETLQMFVINLIKNKNHMNLCIKLLKKNLKYFSEKAKEDYNLLILDNIKKYLIDNNQYDILNDLSVIFDCIQNIKHNPNIILNNIHKTKHNLLNNKRIMKNKKRITGTGAGAGNNENDNVADVLNNDDDDDDDRNSTNSTHSNTTTNSSSNSSSNSSNSSSGVYILENSFCDNLKINKHNNSSPSSTTSSIFKSSKLTASTTADKHLKDMLLTVTGKFGKNIIKYKFNIFNDEQKSLVVEDLLPNVKSKNFNNITTLNATTTIKNDTNNIGVVNKNQKQNLPQTSIYQEFNKNEKDKIYENQHNTDNKRQQNECSNNDDDDDDNDDDEICDHVIVKKNSLKLIEEKIITEEEKTVYDLYIIWKSSKISNLCFLDRYRKIFDRYTSKDIIKLLNKLEVVMIENESNSDTSDIDDDDDNDDDENNLNDHKNDIDINDHIDKNIIIKDNHNHNNRNQQQHNKNLRHNNRLLKSKIYCYEIYFNYLKSELIWEIDDITRDYIRNGFILLNTINKNYNDNDNNDDNNLKNNKNSININCFKCNYPLIFSLDCKYRNIGEELYKFYKSRNELIKCLDLIQNVPSLMNILCKYYLIKYHEYNNNDNDNTTDIKYNNLINNDHNNDDIDIDDINIDLNNINNDDNYNNDLCKKLIKIPLYYGDIKLFMDISKYYDNKLWNYCFELFSNIQNNKLYCIECNECNIIEKKYLIYNKNNFYKWNTFLDLTLNYLESDIFLSLLLKYSNLMPNNCIKKDVFIKCLLK